MAEYDDHTNVLRVMHRLNVRDSYSCKCLAFSADGSLVTWDDDKRKGLRVWNTKSGKEKGWGMAVFGVSPFFSYKSDLRCAAFTPDGSAIIMWTSDGIEFWDVPHGQKRMRETVKTAFAMVSTIAPDGRLAAGAPWKGQSLVIYDLKTGQELRCFGKEKQHEGHLQDVTCLTFSPDGTRLLSTAKDGTVRIWDVQAGREIHRLHVYDPTDEKYPSAIRALFTPDGQRVVSAHDDDVVLWNLTPLKSESPASDSTPEPAETAEPKPSIGDATDQNVGLAKPDESVTLPGAQSMPAPAETRESSSSPDGEVDRTQELADLCIAITRARKAGDTKSLLANLHRFLELDPSHRDFRREFEDKRRQRAKADRVAGSRHESVSESY